MAIDFFSGVWYYALHFKQEMENGLNSRSSLRYALHSSVSSQKVLQCTTSHLQTFVHAAHSAQDTFPDPFLRTKP